MNNNDNKPVSRIKAIREFFGNVTMDEVKALTPQDREELAVPCAKALGLTLEAAPQSVAA